MVVTKEDAYPYFGQRSIVTVNCNGVSTCGLLFVTTLFYIVLVEFLYTTTARTETRVNTMTELQETNHNAAIQNYDGREQETKKTQKTRSQNTTNETRYVSCVNRQC